MSRRVGLALYLAALAGSVLLFNADAENAWSALALAGVASIALGWAAGRPIVAWLAILAIPFAVPFGYADEFLGSDAPQVWWFGASVAVISAALILASVGVRRLAGRGRAA